jgi:hypothetical protein
MTARKGKPEPRSTPISTSGLLQADKEVLTKRLNALDALNRCSFLLGGTDRWKVEDAIKRIRARLSPEPPSALIKFADAVLGQYVPNASWVSDEIRQEVMRAVG